MATLSITTRSGPSTRSPTTTPFQAGRSVLVRYEFRIPADVKGPLTVTARVNYRHLRQSYLNNVFGADHPAYPVVEIGLAQPRP